METIDNIKNLAKLNLSVDEICRTLGISKAVYQKTIKAAKYKKPRIADKRLDNVEEILYELRNTRTPKKEICAKYKISFHTLQVIEKENAVKI